MTVAAREALGVLRIFTLSAVLFGAAAAAQVSEPAPELGSRIRGLTLRPEVGTGIFGYELTGNLGYRATGAMSWASRRYVLLWDARAEATVGGVAYEHPYYVIYGAQARGDAEGGYRFKPAATWSPYLAVRAAASGSAIGETTAPLNGGTRVNNGGDLLGPLASGRFAVGGGASGLDGARSLVAHADLILLADSPRSYLPGRAFIGAAVRARYDLSSRLVAAGEAWYGVGPAQKDAALGTSSQTNRWGLSADLLFTLGAHFMAGLGLQLQRDETWLSYAGARGYSTAPPIDSRLWLTVGYAR